MDVHDFVYSCSVVNLFLFFLQLFSFMHVLFLIFIIKGILFNMFSQIVKSFYSSRVCTSLFTRQL